MKKLVWAVLNTKLYSEHKTQSRILSIGKTATLSKYLQVVDYVLHSYATEENSTKIEDEIIMFFQPPNKNPMQYAEEQVTKATQCDDVYDGHGLNDIFIKELDNCVRQNMRGLLSLTKIG